jgi:hypothetical protein
MRSLGTFLCVTSATIAACGGALERPSMDAGSATSVGTGTADASSSPSAAETGVPATEAGQLTRDATVTSSLDAGVDQIRCGDAVCSSGSEVCCVDPGSSALCTALNDCPYEMFECSSALSCGDGPNHVCCLGGAFGPFDGPGSWCGAESPSDCTTLGGVVICASDSECPNGMTCTPSPIAAGMRMCTGP